MRKIKFGVIGLKGVGQTHINEIANIEGAELTAVADINEEVGKFVSSKYNVKWYKNYEDMLAMEDLDAISICTPHFLHFPMVMKALNYGKHVLVEKPMAITVKEADQMIEEARRRGLKLGVVYQRRTDPTYQKIKEMISQGEIGRIYRACMEVCTFRSQAYYDRDAWRGKWATEGGGVLINQTIHQIDILQWLVGKPVEVCGKIGTFYHNVEVEDIASAVIKFENEAHGVIQVTTIDPINFERFEICGEKGKIVSEDGRNEIKYAILDKSVKEYIFSETTSLKPTYQWNRIEIKRDSTMPGHRKIIEDFVRAIVDDRDPMIPGEEGKVSLEIVNAIILSSFEGRSVSIPIDREAYERLIKEKLGARRSQSTVL
ncbi:MAG: Gfo/Idh/MocA family oxidoreductase [Candidatus Bathyarchaeia archaeon]